MKFKEGQKIAYFRNGELVEEEICWVCDDDGIFNYYHLRNDDKIGEKHVMGYYDENGEKHVLQSFYAEYIKGIEDLNNMFDKAVEWSE